jgi:hypothetical protein
MNDYHINVFYSHEDGGSIADIPRPRGMLGVRDQPAGGNGGGSAGEGRVARGST